MDNSAFKYGRWICGGRFAELEPVNLLHRQSENTEAEPADGLKNLHMLVRRTVNIEKPRGRIYLRITADDYYKLYINGEFVGQGPAQGYPFCYYWNEYDITDFLKSGENSIFADVYYQGLIGRAYNSGDRRMGMIAEAAGSGGCIFATDSEWEYTFSKAYTITHIIGYDAAFAENFDSRVKPDKWEKCLVKETDYIFSPEPAKPLQVYKKEPESVEKLPSGGILCDFGSEITGSLSLTAVGKSGETVRILCGEELSDSPERVRYDMRCCCLYDERWVLGKGECKYEQYEYRGFRYAAIIPENGAEILSVKAIVRHYPFDDGYCTLKTESAALKAVWNICKNAVKYGSQEVYVDCPTREKGQYSGDTVITGAAQVILTGDTSLLKKAIDNQMQSAKINAGLMAVTPGSFMQEIADYSLQFPIAALFYYKHTGDKRYLAENLSVCEGIISHFRKFERADGLLESVTDKWNLVDWPENMRDGYDFPLTVPVGSGCHNVINAFYIGCVMQTEQIRDILGIKAPKRSAELRAAFNAEFFNAETGLYVDRKGSLHSSVHSNIIPAYYGICPAENEQKTADWLIERGMCCSVYMAYFLLKALCRMGRYKAAYSLIVSRGEHSWLNMISEGATTCFEAWGKEQKWNTSLCHPWASAPIIVLAEDILPNRSELGSVDYSK